MTTLSTLAHASSSCSVSSLRGMPCLCMLQQLLPPFARSSSCCRLPISLAIALGAPPPGHVQLCETEWDRVCEGQCKGRCHGAVGSRGLGPGPGLGHACMTVRGVAATTEVEWLRSDHRSTAHGAWRSSQRRI